MTSPPPPPVRSPRRSYGPVNVEAAGKAIETAARALAYVTVGPPIIRYGPGGEVSVDVPLMYQGFALDRVHFDPVAMAPSPKGRPVHAYGVRVDPGSVREVMESVLGELRVLDAAEYREPEAAWAVPIAWRRFIVAHVKVSSDGFEVIPDYGLTEEVRRLVG